MDTAENLNVRITADNSDFLGKLNGLKNIANSVMGGLSKSMKSFSGDSLKGLSSMTSGMKNLSSGAAEAAEKASKLPATLMGIAGAIAAIVAVLKKCVDLANKAAEMGDNIDKMSQKLNMSSDSFQDWSYMMDIAGGSVESLKTPMNKMITQANKDSEAFQKLGVAVRDGSGQLRNSEELFNETVEALSRVENKTERAALAQQIFGKSAADLNPLLNQGAEGMRNLQLQADIFGTNMSGTAVQLSAQYQDAKATIASAAKGVTAAVGSSFLPVLIRICKWVATALAYIRVFVQAVFGTGKATQEAGDKGTTSLAKASTGAKKYTKSLKNATAAAKELKRQTMGFDEMNILSSNKSSGTSGDSSGLADSDYDIGDAGVSAASSLFSEEELNTLNGKLEKFKATMEWLGPALKDWGIVVGMLGGLVLFIIGACTANIPLMIAGGALFGGGLALGLSEDENGESGFEHLFESIKNIVKDLGTWAKGKWKDFKDWIATKWDEAKQWFSNLPLVKGIKEAWKTFKDWYDEKVKPKLTKKYWEEKLDTIKNAFSSLLGKLKDKWEKSKVKKAFEKLSNVKATLTAKFVDGTKKIREKLEKAWDKFKNIKATLTAKFNDTFSAPIKRVWNGLATSINKAIDIINKIPKVNISKMPMLATGGIATSATPAIIGEAGAEAVLPLENNTGWMDLLAARINGRAPSKIVLMVDGRQLGYATIDSINDITRTSGSLKLQLV